MRDLRIRAEGLSKRYTIGGAQEQYATLRDTLADAVKAPFRLLRRARGRAAGDEAPAIWALRDVSLEVKQGDVLGIIGRNGAGKTTLLKILSRITEPTEGRAEIHGRVASLLEVGTGFHPELTGRENVYLSGTILGMRKAEIDRKFDEIVAFSGIEKFLDTPVKRYSSGMYVRLAFGVAAHLEPEVLVVDEVLAVGDAEFQNKCLGKMDEVGKQGRTVLFVSHNMQAMTRLCNRMILLDGGRLVMDGPPEQVVSRYMHSSMGTSAEHAFPADAAPGDDVARLRAVRVRDADGHVSEVVDVRRPVVVELEYEVLQPFPLVPYVQLNNEQGYAAFCSFDTDRTWADRPKPPGTWLSAARIPGNLLSEGTYVVRVGMISYTPFRRFFNVWDAVAFRVIDPMEGGSARGAYVGHIPGVVRPFLEWETTAR